MAIQKKKFLFSFNDAAAVRFVAVFFLFTIWELRIDSKPLLVFYAFLNGFKALKMGIWMNFKDWSLERFQIE